LTDIEKLQKDWEEKSKQFMDQVNQMIPEDFKNQIRDFLGPRRLAATEDIADVELEDLHRGAHTFGGHHNSHHGTTHHSGSHHQDSSSDNVS